MDVKQVFEQIRRNVSAFIKQKTPESRDLWQHFCLIHPADIAQFISRLNTDDLYAIFSMLPHQIRLAVFENLSTLIKVFVLSRLDDKERSFILSHTPIDELTDLFDSLSDQELEKYLTLLSKQDRTQVLSLMQFDPESAGGMMDTDVLTLIEDFTVEKSIHILQRLQHRRKLYQFIYVVDKDNHVMGYIRLEDLLLKKPDSRLGSFMHKDPVTVRAEEDREQVAKKMQHYNLITVPVVGDEKYFLGVIQSDTLIDIIEQEASEDVYRMSAMPAIKYPYFETSFLRILFERSYILVALLLAQSLSSLITKRYEGILCGILLHFITMLISTGGNSSSQTSAVVVQGMASGQINSSTMGRFLRREILMAFSIAAILGVVAFVRVYVTVGQTLTSVAVSAALALIVLVSVLLGSCIPLVLHKLKVDPAYAAGPFLATLMDILGLFIYCSVAQLILF